MRREWVTRAARSYAEALTSDPEERLARKLFNALRAPLISSELRAEPIFVNKLENEEALEALEVLLVDVALVEVLLVEELLELNRLVRSL
jgi:hypothetical protein